MANTRLHLSLLELGASDAFLVALSREVGEIASPPRVGDLVELLSGVEQLWPEVTSVMWDNDLTSVELRLVVQSKDPDKVADDLELLGWIRDDAVAHDD